MSKPHAGRATKARRAPDSRREASSAVPDSASPLAAVPAESRTRLFPLLRLGPTVVEELCGKRPHKLTLLRWAVAGSHGVKLRTTSVGRARYSSRAWLVEFWNAVDEARRAE